MKIACIGWGSLVWNPHGLLTKGIWHNDGPYLPIEFERQSDNGLLTLVISQKAKPVRALWILMDCETIESAKESLRLRERILPKNFNVSIASVSRNDKVIKDPIKEVILKWLDSHELDYAIWTNLSPKFKGQKNCAPNLQEAVDYLRSLDYGTLQTAKDYIVKAPEQIDTEFRQEFKREFGW